MAACSVWWRLVEPRRVPVPAASPASIRAASSAIGSARTRTAASSMASGMPSSRRQSRMTSGRSGSVSREPADRGRGALREQFDRVARPGVVVAPQSVPGTGSGPSLSTSSPGTCSGCLLVARILTSLVSRRTVSTNSAQAAVRCSQVSRISSSFLPRSSLEHRLEPAGGVGALQAEAQRDGVGEQFGIGEAGQLDEAAAVRAGRRRRRRAARGGSCRRRRARRP